MIQAKREMFSCLRLAAVLWLSIWVLMVPLFHVHPEADHRHGEAGHVHGGTVHTVWSPDLDGEFDSHRQVDRTEQSTQDGICNLAQFSHVGDSHAEVSLSLLNDSTDRKSLKPFVTQAFGFSSAVVSGVEWYVRLQRNAASVQLSVLFITTRSPRAPPSFLV
jgi:hypothetical protein